MCQFSSIYFPLFTEKVFLLVGEMFLLSYSPVSFCQRSIFFHEITGVISTDHDQIKVLGKILTKVCKIRSFSKEDDKNVNASSTRRHTLILYIYLDMPEIYCKFADLDCSNYRTEKLLKI